MRMRKGDFREHFNKLKQNRMPNFTYFLPSQLLQARILNVFEKVSSWRPHEHEVHHSAHQ